MAISEFLKVHGKAKIKGILIRKMCRLPSVKKYSF